MHFTLLAAIFWQEMEKPTLAAMDDVPEAGPQE